MLFSYNYKKRCLFEYKQSKIVGISCFFYFISFLLFSDLNHEKYYAFITSVVSFLSDYYYVRRVNTCIIFIDWVIASSFLLWNWYRCYNKAETCFFCIFCVCISFLSAQILRKSQRCENMEKWIIMHTLWHFVGAFACGVTLVIY